MEVDKDNEIVSLVSSSSECKKEAASQSGKRLYPVATESILNDSTFTNEQIGINFVVLVRKYHRERNNSLILNLGVHVDTRYVEPNSI